METTVEEEYGLDSACETALIAARAVQEEIERAERDFLVLKRQAQAEWDAWKQEVLERKEV